MSSRNATAVSFAREPNLLALQGRLSLQRKLDFAPAGGKD